MYHVLRVQSYMYSLDALVCLAVELAEDGLSLLVNELVSVGAVAVHVTEPIRSPAVREQETILLKHSGVSIV